MESVITEEVRTFEDAPKYLDAKYPRGGATYAEIAAAKEEALNDPAMREEARETYAQMRKALEGAGTAAAYEEILRDLPPRGKPN